MSLSTWHRAEPRPFVDRAYGGVVIDDRRRVLLREPRNHFGGYCWTFAKGGADEGESPSDAALREVREETGWACEAIAEIEGWFVGTTSDTKFFLMSPIEDHGDFHDEPWTNSRSASPAVRRGGRCSGRGRDLQARRIRCHIEECGLRTPGVVAIAAGLPTAKPLEGSRAVMFIRTRPLCRVMSTEGQRPVTSR